VDHLTEIATKITLTDRASLLRAASTSLNSKIVSQYSALLAPIAVDAVMRVINPATAENVDLNDIRIVKKVGGTIDDTELVEGLVLNQSVIKNAGGPTRMEKAKIGLIQFQLSPPKPDVTPTYEETNGRWRIRLWSTIIDRWIRFSRKNELIY
jgi:T-complex protein 1 subunit delta